jgi:hypothetical protein
MPRNCSTLASYRWFPFLPGQIQRGPQVRDGRLALLPLAADQRQGDVGTGLPAHVPGRLGQSQATQRGLAGLGGAALRRQPPRPDHLGVGHPALLADLGEERQQPGGVHGQPRHRLARRVAGVPGDHVGQPAQHDRLGPLLLGLLLLGTLPGVQPDQVVEAVADLARRVGTGDVQ